MTGGSAVKPVSSGAVLWPGVQFSSCITLKKQFAKCLCSWHYHCLSGILGSSLGHIAGCMALSPSPELRCGHMTCIG